MSDDRTYKVDLKAGNILAQFTDIFQDIFARRTLAAVKDRVNTAVDRELSQVLKRISRNILSQDFSETDPYLPKAWKRYSRGYAKMKYKRVGYLDWFRFGYRIRSRAGEPPLTSELASISNAAVLESIGETVTKVSRDKKKISISVAPRVSITANNMERELGDILDDRTMKKLQNRKRAYRALLGPEFIFMLNERIPQLVERSLARF